MLKGELSRAELMQNLRLKDEKHFREKYIRVGLELVVIERTIPDKPQSKLQKYLLTEMGKICCTKNGIIK